MLLFPVFTGYQARRDTPSTTDKRPHPPAMTAGALARRIRVQGRIQGVGYRPFVLRLALRHDVRGWVRNQGGYVEIHAEGESGALDRFTRALIESAPPLAAPEPPLVETATAGGHAAFLILGSRTGAVESAVIPPDHFVCAECLAEMADPGARRHRYPFINCTQCGPRYTIIERLPYDRPHTAMAAFPLCPACREEYENPADRRYHAQPLACAECGPRLSFHEPGRAPIIGNEAALAACVARLREGLIVAAKGIGGYHLLTDAGSECAVQRLRQRKHRPDKPLAVLLPESILEEDLERAGIAAPDQPEWELLRSPWRPIVLTRKARNSRLAPGLAPGLDEIGLMLPYSPLHHLLSADFGGPLVATSANLSGEPVLTEAEEVEARLGGVADAFLHHDRPIRRPADDSVFRTLAGKPRPLRLGRGLAPVELRLSRPLSQPLLALGADLKNTIALGFEDRVIMSPHLGDLGTPRSERVFEQVIEDCCRLYGVRPERLIHDAHPDYYSSQWASRQGGAVTSVFHHHAHASALAGERGADEPLLVFAWDGLGYGEDGSLWGGETLLGVPGAWRRVASLRPFRLIGGDKASREPWRCALALCLELGLEWPAAPGEAGIARHAWTRGINSPWTSSMGRLFDAAAALIGMTQSQTHEGHAAMRLETLAAAVGGTPVAMPLIERQGRIQVDWRPLVPMLLNASLSIGMRASNFHASLAASLLDQAHHFRERHDIRRVGLTGGVFQNRCLVNQARNRLIDAGFSVLMPERLPVNDACISFGQIVEVQAREAL